MDIPMESLKKYARDSATTKLIVLACLLFICITCLTGLAYLTTYFFVLTKSAFFEFLLSIACNVVVVSFIWLGEYHRSLKSLLEE